MNSQQNEPPQVTLARDSHHDVITANEYRRSLIQVVVLINGGAATAILTYYGSTKFILSDDAMQAAAIALVFYCLGIFFAAMSAYRYSRSANQWATVWEKRTYWKDQEKNKCKIKKLSLKAKKHGTVARLCLLIGIICFPLASIATAQSLYLAMTSASQLNTSAASTATQSTPNNQPSSSMPQTST